MVVGKTSSSISKEEIFNYFSEIEVLSSVFPEIKSLPTLICSPLRKDNHPSFSIYVNSSNHIRFKDFATGEGGGLSDLLCRCWNCSFNDVLQKLSDKLIRGKDIAVKRKFDGTCGIKITKSEDTRIEVRVREWRDYDIEYWTSYGCNIKLLKYAEVYPISHKIIYKGNKKYTFGTPKYCYCYVERKEGKVTKKIYSPYAKQYKWVTDNDKSVVGLWEKVPEYGECVCICSSLKDAICLRSNSNIPTIYIQGEAYNMSETAIKELKRRFKTIFICLDNDNAGLLDAQKLAEKTGFTNIVIPPFKGGKDLSDYFKVNGRERFKKEIVPLFTLKLQVAV